ncbi:MAG: metalloprotease PmbA [Gammaproteobacteria bacterium]|jgi:PmbA protein
MTDTSTAKPEIDRYQQIVEDLLAEARSQGASAAEAGVSGDAGLAVTVRLGDIETVERTKDHSLGVTVYFGQRKGSASTTDLSPEAVRETVSAACRIARHASEDRCAGLPPEERLARSVPDLDLYHPWPLAVAEAADLAVRCEAAARAYDARIDNSEGATVSTQSGEFVYGNSLGFIGGYPTSRHSVSCAVIAREGESMQRDYWYTNARTPAGLDAPEAVGRRAAERTVSRLGARRIGTRRVPVLFRADIAPSLLRGLLGAIRGPALYRQASFLLDQLDQPVFPPWVRIHEDPLLVRGLASAPFDNEGVATVPHDLVREGVLRSYVLDSYAARRLGMATTGNAGGVRNLAIESGPDARGFDDLVRDMGTGLIVTEMMGQGTNTVTGDYSRGAAGLWVEHGEIRHPVEEITVAGNLRDMFARLQAVGTDDRIPGSTRTGSWLVDGMTVAGD